MKYQKILKTQYWYKWLLNQIFVQSNARWNTTSQKSKSVEAQLNEWMNKDNWDFLSHNLNFVSHNSEKKN